MTSALITLICRCGFPSAPLPLRPIVRSSETASARQSSGVFRWFACGKHTQGDRSQLTPAELHHPPRFGWYTRLDFILSFFISHFSFLLVFGLNRLCRRDLNIAFMLHRVTRRCLLRKPSLFITWKFIARPLNRDEAKKKDLQPQLVVWWSWWCLTLVTFMHTRRARFISENLLRPLTLLKLATRARKETPWEIYGLRRSRGEQNAIHLATEESRKRD